VVERGELPPGFSLTIFGEVPSPTSLTFGPDDRLYVASANQVVYALADKDGDHRADARVPFARGVPIPLGLLWIEDTLYISYNGNVAVIKDKDGDGVGDRVVVLITGLPASGRHQNDGLVLGADGYIYLGMGSTCDACREGDPRSATILRFKPDGTGLSVFATGLRNPYDLAFNAAGDLFATDNGRDDLGSDAPPEELNLIRAGLDYGWPDCWQGNTAAACASKSGAVATFAARSSADGLVFYEGHNFPQAYQDNAFVAVLGSYAYPDIERGVARVRLAKTGDTYRGETEWFLKLEEGRPLDVTVGPDGGLYVADYDQGLIYRIVYGAP
jgi:putative membrane-bound dehydrogenase-like protein